MATYSTASSADAFCTSGSSPTARPLRRASRTGTFTLPDHVLARLSFTPAPAELRFELQGNPDGPTVVALGGISAHRHVAAHDSDPSPGWWEAIAGPGRALDGDRVQILSFDFLSGDLPAGDSLAERRPPSTFDQAEALAFLLDQLQIDSVRLLAGASYGGMVGLAFAARHPERLERLLTIGAAHRTHPLATAWRSLQRQIVQLGLETGRADRALEIARGLAMTTYRSAAELESRFGAAPDAAGRFPVEDYLAARGRAFAAAFEPSRFLALSESIDRHAVEPLELRVPTTLVYVDSDALVPPWLVAETAREAPGPVHLRELRSPAGHDAFLVESEAVSRLLLEELAAAEGVAR
jgi:homoserine O-acetyltransferase/O-succinyltransferase